jgi:hypothetical protein
MADEPTTQPTRTEARCMWCSAVLPDPSATTCPSCGATLVGDGETGSVPGLTAIDADAILRNARNASRAKPRTGILGWISGDYPVDESSSASAGSLAPPTADVRREMLRLELEAQVANAQAEVEAMAADEAIAEGAQVPSDIVNQEGLFEPATEDMASPASAGAVPAPEADAAGGAAVASDTAAGDTAAGESTPTPSQPAESGPASPA